MLSFWREYNDAWVGEDYRTFGLEGKICLTIQVPVLSSRIRFTAAEQEDKMANEVYSIF